MDNNQIRKILCSIEGAAFVESALTIVVFCAVFAACVSFGSYALKDASMNYVLINTSRWVAIATPENNTFTNQLTRTMHTTTEIENYIIREGKKVGLFQNETSPSCNIRICTTLTNCVPNCTADQQPLADSFFAISIRHNIFFFWGKLRIPVTATIIGKTE